MKFHLPKKLMLAVLAAMAVGMTANAGYVTLGEIVNVEKGSSATINPADIVIDNYAPYAKDGEGQLLIQTTGTMKAAFYVREGEVKVSDGATLTINPNNTGGPSGPTKLNIAGKDASMVIDGASVICTGSEHSMCVGGPDGNGTLLLDNGAYLKSVVSFFIGYSGYVDKPVDEIGFGNAHATTQGVGQELTLENRYEGNYTAAENGSGDMFGRGVVTVQGGSSIYTGYTNLVVNDGELNIKGEGSVVTCGTLNWSGGAIFARQDNSTAYVNVTEGGSLVVEGDFTTSMANNAISNIVVDGKGSTFYVSDVDGNGAHDSDYVSNIGSDATKSNVTNLTISNGGAATFAQAVMGAQGGVSKVNVSIDAASSLTIKNAWAINDGTTITNSGTISAGSLTLNGGMITLLDPSTSSMNVTGAMALNGGTIQLGVSNILATAEENTVKIDVLLADAGSITGEGTTLVHNSLLWNGDLKLEYKDGGLYATGTMTKTEVEENESLDISGKDVTMDSADALGDAPITNTGDATLSTAEGVKVKLPGTIENTGNLTISGNYDVSNMTTSDTEADTKINVSGKEGKNGFLRPGKTVVTVVDNKTGATLTIDKNTTVTKGDDKLHLASSGKAGKVDYSNYYIEDDEHKASVSAIQGMRPDSDKPLTITMNEGVLIADKNAEDIDSEGGTIETVGNVTIGGTGEISGTTSVVVGDGMATLTGDNDYTGDTVISGEKAKLKVNNGKALGHSKVKLHDHGTLDLNGNAVGNRINVTGCTLLNSNAYTGDMAVSGDLLIKNDNGNPLAQMNTLTLEETGTISFENVTEMKLLSGLVLNDGAVLEMPDTVVLTLKDGAVVVLNSTDYEKGDQIVKAGAGSDLDGVTVTMNGGYVSYVVNGSNVIEITGVFHQAIAEGFTVTNWAQATASRAFVNAVRGQRNNTGCIADGKGTVWFSLLGANHDINGSDIDLEGAALGVDMKVGEKSVLGIATGYVEGDIRPNGINSADSESSYLALYGQHGLAKLSNASCLSLDWVAAYGTTETENGPVKWEQDSLQLNTRLNWNKKVTDRLCMSVFGGLEYYTNESDTVDTGAKSGSIQNLRGEIGVGVRYVAWGTPAVTDNKGGLISRGCEKLILHGEVRYMNDMVRSNPVIEMDGLRGTGTNPGRQGMGIEAGATYRIGERWSASANYGFNTMEDSREHRLNVGASYTF